MKYEVVERTYGDEGNFTESVLAGAVEAEAEALKEMIERVYGALFDTEFKGLSIGNMEEEITREEFLKRILEGVTVKKKRVGVIVTNSSDERLKENEIYLLLREAPSCDYTRARFCDKCIYARGVQ